MWDALTMSSPLRVLIDARLVSGAFGGVEQFTIGLVNALSALEDGEEEYLVLTYEDGADWIAPYVRGAARLVFGEASPMPPRLRSMVPGALSRHLRGPWHALRAVRGSRAIPVPRSDGRLERMADVVHFPTQKAVLTSLPTLYHPWDLQHRHLPAFFTPYERLRREVQYTAFARQAELVIVASEWGRADFASVYPRLASKLRVVPVPPVTYAYTEPSPADLDSVRRTLGLEDGFVFYPAKTWQHKNHGVLLEALAELKRRGLRVPLVCSGGETHYSAALRSLVSGLGLDDQVSFVGYVSPLEVQSLYRLARCLVFPSRFEGWGLPLLEAFRAGLPVACSNVTCLPEQAAGAALLFDPDDTMSLAREIERLWLDQALRVDLTRRGHDRAGHYSWSRIARRFRAYYRQLTLRSLSDDDLALIADYRGSLQDATGRV